MLMSVSTRTLPRAGTVVGREAYRSYPAAKALPLVGRRAFSVSFLIRRGGAWSTLVTVLLWVESAIVSVFARLEGGDVGGDVMCSVAAVIVLQEGRII
jgi:hypothetical protein